MKIKTFKDAQEQVDKIIEEFGGYWPPLSMLASVVEEVGEMARHINDLEEFKPKKRGKRKKGLQEEISDTFFSLLCITNYYKIDLGEGLGKVIEKYRRRDKERFREQA